MHVSYGELVRIMPDAIRMLGFSYSQADDSSEAVIWTECVFGVGYELLSGASNLTEWPRKAPIILSDQGDKTVVSVDRPMFAYAARIADLAISKAAAARMSLVRVVGEAGANIAPYIAYRVSRAGYGIALIANASVEHRTLDGRTLVVMPPGGKAISVARGASIPVAEMLNTLPKGYSHEIDRSCSDDSAAGLGTDGELLMITMAKSEIRRLPRRAIALCHLEQRMDVASRIRDAITGGLEVAPERHSVLTRLASKIRVENFGRSRTQAG